MTDVSIIIVNYNTKELVLDCLRSIQNEGSRLNKEIIIVDNASVDGSLQTFKKIDRIKLIINKKNLGFAKASNQGIETAKGKSILLLNSDTKVKKGFLQKLEDFTEKIEDAGVVGPRLLNINGSVQKSVMHFPTILRAIREYWLNQKGKYELYIPECKDFCEVDAVVGAVFWITKKAIKKVGFLDERYFMYFEDLEYCRRVRNAGLKVYYFPLAEVVHYHGVSGKNVVKPELQWQRLIPSSKIYNGILKHYLINFILWSGQKWQSLLKNR